MSVVASFFYPIGEDNLIKLGTHTNLSMLNPVLYSDFRFCVQGVPKNRVLTNSGVFAMFS